MKPKFLGRVTKYYKKRLWEYLVSEIKHTSDENLKRIKQAYNIAFIAHRNQRRKGGEKEPYITHPVEVAIIASKEMGFGTTTVMSALLHDVVEDSEEYDLEYIKNKFGLQIATIVDGVTKITKISGKDSSEQMDTFINMVLTIPDDYRVFIVKIADRLHNMRTMDDMPDNTRRIKSAENLYIYAKIAELVGLWRIKNELENNSFKYMDKENYDLLKKYQEKYDESIIHNLGDFQQSIIGLLKETDFKFNILTIERSIYSVWTKMKKHNLYYKDVHNHYSTRIVLDIDYKINRHTAYPVFWKINETYPEKKGSVRDWIINPKKNGFRALVFDVMYKGQWQEIQVISKDDNEIALNGFLKKESDITPGFSNLGNAIKKDFNIDQEDSIALIDRLQEIINIETIFIFTPKGEMFEMPKNSTVLDFAFRVHTDIGLKCLGAKINNNQAVKSSKYVLQSTERVEILTSDNVVPRREWLEFVTTSRAKKAIMYYLNKIEAENETIEEDNVEKHELNYKKPFIVDDNIEYIVAKCCNPIIGDKAMIYQTKENKLVVHKESCKQALILRARDSKHTATVQWERVKKKNSILVTIEFEGEDRVGIIRDIVNVISEDLGVNMKKISVENFEGFFQGYIELYISSLELLNQIIDKIKDLEYLQKVKRVDNKEIEEDENLNLLFSN